jgi:amidase
VKRGAAFLIVGIFVCGCRGAESRSEPVRTVPPFDLEEVTIADLQNRMQDGTETARSITARYLARIGALDRQGPALRSIIETNPDALADADRLDEERRARGPRGPLHGIPVLVKDNIATGDRMMTSAGSLLLATAPAPNDAFIVARLREAGAIILGKANLSEWANIRSTHSSSGWSARGGQVRNPYVLDRTPIGSSSGSGAAVAANLAPVAVGTETDGSIIAPASAMSLVGLKPTIGLLSRTGIVPISHSQDTPGPMTRTVADAALLLAAMAGTDADDAATAESSSRGLRDYTASLDPAGLKGARIGVVRQKFFGYNSDVDRLAERALAAMKQQGAVIVDPVAIPALGTYHDKELDVLLFELKADLAKYFAWLGPSAPARSLKDVIAFNEAHKADEMPFFGQELFIMAEQKGSLDDPGYKAAAAEIRRLAGRFGIDAVMNEHKLDALVAPSFPLPWLIDLVKGDVVGAAESTPTTVAAVAGYPHITVPMGFYQGLPAGISFFGRAWSEPVLIKLAYAYEQATRHRRPPTFAATANVNGSGP